MAPHLAHLRAGVLPLGRWLLRLLACLVFGFLPCVARAHSLPYGVGLAWSDPTSSALPVIVTNRGIVFAEGASSAQGFSIRCNEAYNANTSDRPNAYLEPSGRLTTGVYNQIFQTSDRGCTLLPSTGLPASQFSSVVRAPSSPRTLYTLVRDVKQAGVYASEDFGQTFEQRFANESDAYYETMVVAPSDAQRLYAAGIHYDRVNLKVTFYASRSLDGGRTWEDTVLDARVTPLAVHPNKPDVLFAYRAIDRLETKFDILRSEDRGKSYKVVLADTYQPTGFVMAGGIFYLGASIQGAFYQSRDDGQSFTPLLSEQIQRVTCLAEHAGKLWMCANIAPNLDAIWILKDDASGVDKVMSFDEVRAPVACASAQAAELCELPWQDYTRELHGSDDAGVPDASVTDAGPSDGDGEISEADAAPALDAAEQLEDDARAEPGSEGKGGEPSSRAARGGGCQLGRAVGAHDALQPLLLLLGLLGGARRGRRHRRRHAQGARAGRRASSVQRS